MIIRNASLTGSCMKFSLLSLSSFFFFSLSLSLFLSFYIVEAKSTRYKLPHTIISITRIVVERTSRIECLRSRVKKQCQWHKRQFLFSLLENITKKKEQFENRMQLSVASVLECLERCDERHSGENASVRQPVSSTQSQNLIVLIIAHNYALHYCWAKLHMITSLQRNQDNTVRKCQTNPCWSPTDSAQDRHTSLIRASAQKRAFANKCFLALKCTDMTKHNQFSAPECGNRVKLQVCKTALHK